MKVQWF